MEFASVLTKPLQFIPRLLGDMSRTLGGPTSSLLTKLSLESGCSLLLMIVFVISLSSVYNAWDGMHIQFIVKK